MVFCRPSTWVTLPVGIATPDGDQPVDVMVPIGSLAMAVKFFGPQSELARMFVPFTKTTSQMRSGVCRLRSRPATAAAGRSQLLLPTAAGTLHFYVAGTYVPVNVGMTDTLDQIAQAITDAINAQVNPNIPLTAVKGTLAGEVDLTATFKGVNGNEIQISLNYYGGRGGHHSCRPGSKHVAGRHRYAHPPRGFLSGGAGTPVWTTAISNLGETPFEYICLGYTDRRPCLIGVRKCRSAIRDVGVGPASCSAICLLPNVASIPILSCGARRSTIRSVSDVARNKLTVAFVRMGRCVRGKSSKSPDQRRSVLCSRCRSTTSSWRRSMSGSTSLNSIRWPPTDWQFRKRALISNR